MGGANEKQSGLPSGGTMVSNSDKSPLYLEFFLQKKRDVINTNRGLLTGTGRR